ncbi:hypothetical protein [Aestuariibacter salexigens]|uniref:hypothetical protein n=1 Tax=Aestuariibacter salexigens TaxID=226010 RepID=UPI0003FA54B4|nr:hypothetical protein [Aestuariibacter salexigens]
MKKAELIGTALLAAVCLQVISAAHANEQDTLLAKLDLDRDGYITLKEASSVPEMLKVFGSIDTNEDGRLSLEELNSATLEKTSTDTASVPAETTKNQ